MEFNIEPYNDDFQTNALDNNYVRILFKPGRAVQARELTQIQSILQNQIKQFGDHIFQNGSPVIGGNLTLDNRVKYVKLQETFNGTDIDVEDFDGKVVRSSDGSAQAKVLTTYFPAEGVPTLLIKYITGVEFADGESIKIVGTDTQAQLVASSANGNGTVCSINEGVFYVDGFFVKVPDQTAVVSPYSTVANVKIGLEITDDIVDSGIDTTLLDPAQGSFNYQAPGADRYQYNLALSTRPLDTVVDEAQFFELMRVESGAITKQVKYPIYAELEKTLARRTFDESGDYTVRPFRATVQNGTDANNYTISIEPGKAYVKGFEFETIGTLKIDAPKPREAADVKTLSDTDVDISYGNFIYVTALRGTSNGFINVASLEKVDIHCVDSSNVLATGTFSGTANAAVYQNTKIGTARVKNFVRSNPDLFNTRTDANGVYKLYLTDININPKVAKANGANAASINVVPRFSNNTNAYSNISVTVLPIRLDEVVNLYANVVQNGYVANANNNATFASKVSVNDIIRIGDMVREVVNVSGGNVTVNTAWDYTLSGAAISVFKQTAYSQNTTGQTRTITRSILDNGNVVFHLDRSFDNNGVPDSNTVIQLNYDIDHAESFIAGPSVSNVLVAVANASMNVSSVSKLITGEASLEDKQRNSLVFRLPATYVSRATLNNSDYNYNKVILNRSNTGTANQFALSQGSGLETFETIPFADSTGAIQDNLIVVVRDNNGNTSYPNGTILQLTSANVTIGSPATSITIDTFVPDILKVDLLINVKQNDAEDKIRKKNFISNTIWSSSKTNFTYPTSENGNTTVTLPGYGVVANVNVAQGFVFLTDPTYNAVRPGDQISLFVPDVVRVNKILAGNTTHLPDANNVLDVTERFYVDYGQKDDVYDHAKLILKSGYDSPNAKLLAHVDFYQHIYAAGSNVSFFSVDSYAQSQYENGSIPVYISKDGTVLNLRDCLDFRPTRTLGDGALSFINPNIPSPDEVTEVSFSYYLPRIDKLVLSKDKEFRIVKGKSSPQPLPPEDVDDAMTLYTVRLPPYVADVREIKMNYNENRRYTMKDISSIDKRVQKVEFFTSLNNVENLAFADKTQYEDGTEKEKYGIVGENFLNFNIADYKNPDFNAALEAGFLIPPMNVNAVGFKRVGVSGSQTNRKTVTLQYTETPAIVQGLAANKAVSVQPFLFGQFNGSVFLAPETDYWVSETLKPEVITVPERIIEKQTVIREIVIEPAPPTTLPVPTSNCGNQIIVTPGDNPPPVQDDDKVIVTPPDPPAPVITPDPVPADPPETCPAPWMMIQLVGGMSVPAGELKPGMFVKTYHEVTKDLGTYEVTHVESIQDAKRLQIEFEHVDFVCSHDHKFYKDGDWVKASELEEGDVVGLAPNEYEVLGVSEFDDGEVIRITVDEAHTYVCEGILSHNKQPIYEPPIFFEFDPWWSIIPRNLFSPGGIYDGTTWYPYVPMPIVDDKPIESQNPNASPPISLGGGGGCPDPKMYILLDGGLSIRAGMLEPGMMILTKHENTMEEGAFRVEAVSIEQQPKLILVFKDEADENVLTKLICSESHKFHHNDSWIEAKDLQLEDVVQGKKLFIKTDIGMGDVVRITVEDAHTYVCQGFLSHNKNFEYEIFANYMDK